MMQTVSNGKKKIPTCRQLSPKQKKILFDKYVLPHLDDVKSLTRVYTSHYSDVEDNYNHCLAQLYYYIGSYNPDQKLSTWLHICVKRACQHKNKEKAEESSHYTDIEMCSHDELHKGGYEHVVDPGFGMLLDNISDEMYHTLLKIPAIRLSPFLMSVQGHKIREIAAAERKKGNISKSSGEDLIKSRIFWARMQLKFLLKQYGITGANE